MSVESDLVKLLKGAHSGEYPNYSSRVYADYAPQDVTYPCAVYENDQETPDITWDGDSGYSVHEFTITLMAADKADVIADVEYLKTYLQGFKGNTFWTGATYGVTENNFLLIEVSPGPSYGDEERKLYIRELYLTAHISE